MSIRSKIWLFVHKHPFKRIGQQRQSLRIEKKEYLWGTLKQKTKLEMRNIFLLAILAIFISCGTSEPQTSKQEYEPTISYDISNQQINDFEEDKDGHI